ncbi:replication initiation protein (plasmid) [Cytobacillus oceanisediminis]|nr:replication initiation protein [Cytobacillus oceanisediminis]QOK29908.1 replication initiation protein [Cytobacillus oceanisediminis]
MGTGRITIQLSDGLARYLLNLEKYAKYRLYNVLRLSSEYSWRIYELLKEYEWKRERIIRVDELRKLLSIPDDKMRLMKVFRKTVLEKAKAELKEKTDIEFKYEVHSKAGRNIESFFLHR